MKKLITIVLTAFVLLSAVAYLFRLKLAELLIEQVSSHFLQTPIQVKVRALSWNSISIDTVQDLTSNFRAQAATISLENAFSKERKIDFDIEEIQLSASQQLPASNKDEFDIGTLLSLQEQANKLPYFSLRTNIKKISGVHLSETPLSNLYLELTHNVSGWNLLSNAWYKEDQIELRANQSPLVYQLELLHNDLSIFSLSGPQSGSLRLNLSPLVLKRLSTQVEYLSRLHSLQIETSYTINDKQEIQFSGTSSSRIAELGNLSAAIAGRITPEPDSNSSQMVLHAESRELGTVDFSLYFNTEPSQLRQLSFVASLDRVFGTGENFRRESNQLFQIDQGTIHAEMKGDLNTQEFLIRAKDLSGEINQLKIIGLNSDIHGRLQNGLQSQATIKIDKISGTMPIENLETELNFKSSDSKQSAEVSLLKASMLGGALSASSFNFSPSESVCQSILVAVQQLSLSEVLSLYASSDIKATGSLDGEIPVSICKDSWGVDSARLSASGPGEISYKSASPIEHPELNFAVQALRDFHYKTLSAELSVAQDGKMLISLHIEGQSKSLPKPQPLVLNLNLEENLGKLIESLQVVQKVGNSLAARKVSLPGKKHGK